MPIKSSGTLSFSDIRNEAGPVGTSSLSLLAYRGAMAGIPLSGPIKLSDFYGKTFLVTEIITGDTVWSPKINFARFIHIFVVGAGGSGGHGWPNDDPFNDGVAGGAGGAGGGVAYSKVIASSITSATITIGNGGVGVTRTTENGFVYGNRGADTTVFGSGLNMIGGGGSGGPGASRTDPGTTSTSGPGAVGGIASGGNVGNYDGGNSGGFSVSGVNQRSTASGGGSPRFKENDPTSSQSSTTDGTTPGMKVSEYGSWPSILTDYITGRDQTQLLGPSITDYDATDGSINTAVPPGPVYGAGSGGSGRKTSDGSSDGGDGIVIIVYEI